MIFRQIREQLGSFEDDALQIEQDVAWSYLGYQKSGSKAVDTGQITEVPNWFINYP